MKVAIVIVPMMRPKNVEKLIYPVEGNKAIEYEKPIRCPVNGILAKTMKKGEEVKIIYIMTVGENSYSEPNKKAFIDEIEDINNEIGANLSYNAVELEFLPTNKTFNKLITDLAEIIPDKAEIYADITYGTNTEILSIFFPLRFVDEFCSANIQYIVYGKAERNKDTGKLEKQRIYDITSLYYLFKLMGTMGATDAKTAMKVLKDFFAL